MAHIHTSRGLASHSTVFGFSQVSPYKFRQSWGAHIFQDGMTDVLFNTKRDLFKDSLIPVFCKYLFSLLLQVPLRYLTVVFPGFIAHMLYFADNTITYF